MNKRDCPTLRELREQNKKTLSEVAKALGVTIRAVSNYEQGIRKLNIEQLIPLSQFYDVDIEEIILAQLQSIFVRKSQ